MIRIIIHGALGKMGIAVADAVALDAGKGDKMIVVAGVDLFAAGAKCSFPIFESLEQCDVQADVVVDFTRGDALPGVLSYCAARRMPCVIASTGMGEEQQRMMDEAAKLIPVFQCANMSLGVNMMLDLVRMAAMALGEKFDVEIVEAHHNTKLDAPSGTAYMLLNAVQKGLPEEFTPVYDRSGRREPRAPKEIGMSSIRGGTVTGTHEVLFLGPDEELIIKHVAQSRRIFALGALSAVRYVVGRAPGRYDMEHVIIEHTAVERLDIVHDQAMITLRDVLHTEGFARLFATLAREGVNIDMISQTAPTGGYIQVSFTLPAASLAGARRAMAGMQYDVQERLVKLAVEGTGMVHKPGVAARVFGLLSEQGALPMLITTSETKIAICLPEGGEHRAEAALREAFGI